MERWVASGNTSRKSSECAEPAGVEFIDENGGGPGVRLKRPTKGKERK